MAELVDAIVADLMVKYEQYVAGFDRATAAHQRFTKSVPKIGAMGGFTQAEAQQYADRHSKVGDAAEKAGEKRKRAAKGASDTEKAEAKAAADAVKKAAREREQAEKAAARASEAATKASEREKQAALKATQREQEKAAKAATAKAEAERAAAAVAVAAAERETAARARLAEVAQRAVNRRASGIAPAIGGRIGAAVPRESSGQSSIPLSVLNNGARAEVEAEKEINHLLADQAVLSSRLTSLKGRERDVVRDQLADIRLTRQLERAGLDDAAIALRLEERRAAVAGARGRNERAQANRGLEQYARGAGLSAATGGGAALAGIATAVGVGVGVEVIRSAVDYGKALDDLSKQLGITVEDLQAYLKLARDTGVEQATLSSAFGQFASNLGRAQQGQEEYSKVFKALGVEIKDFSTAGDALPTIIARISSIKDPLQRAAVETRLFGEEGRKLDPLLSGGAKAVSNLSGSMQKLGTALSAKEIQELDETGRKLGEIKNQLQVDFARVVSGNADAIITLARAFETAASAAANFFARLSRQGDLDILNNPTVVKAATLITGRDPKAVRNEAFNRQLESREGRNALYERNKAQRAELAGRASFGSDGVDRLEPERQRLEKDRNTIARAEVAARKRERAAVTPPVQTGNVNMGLIRNLGAPNPPKGKSAKSLAREEEQRTRQFSDQLAQATAGYLRAQEQLTGSADKRAAIELELLDTASKARIADIESQRKRNVLAGANAGIEAARAAELTAAERRARNEDALVIEQERRFAKERALTTATSSLLDARAMVLSAELSLARTNADRRRIQLELVDNQEQQDRTRLNGVIASSPVDSPEAQQARVDLSRLPERSEIQRRVIRDQTLDPLDQYKKDLHSATDDTNAALQSIEVNALQSLEDSLSRSIGKVLGLKGAFGDLVGSVLTDIARLELKKGILSLLDRGSGGGGAGGIIAGIGRAIGLGGTRAVGGNVVGGVPYLVGERGPELVTMGGSGKVYPNGALPGLLAGGNSAPVVHQHFKLNAPNAIMFPEFVAGVKNYVDTKASEAGRAAYGGAVRDVPRQAIRNRPLKS